MDLLAQYSLSQTFDVEILNDDGAELGDQRNCERLTRLWGAFLDWITERGDEGAERALLRMGARS